ncbi:hypothetical protein CW747_02455 [Staphylococcus shinii]|uniref:NUMOD4 domain-containing protein n=1 Tax=Staphylococcus shinii TaxID=2912228 RepID=UPI000C336C25|nr:NUMOD4 domain-containing protein [Staphylococcus shinii]PKI11019.1 hypothetical protein CW747_02455 [Staphylococcus shinii]
MNYEEIWKNIEGYEGMYQVSNKGNVKSLDRKVLKGNGQVQIVIGKILKLRKNKNGYLQVMLYNDGRKNHNVHRLVANAFIKNINSKDDVNHLDEVKTNNNVQNLECVSHKENMNYGTRTYRTTNKLSIPIIGVHIVTGHIINFTSAKEASRNGFHQGTISSVLRGEAEVHKGYKWYRESEYQNA